MTEGTVSRLVILNDTRVTSARIQHHSCTRCKQPKDCYFGEGGVSVQLKRTTTYQALPLVGLQPTSDLTFPSFWGLFWLMKQEVDGSGQSCECWSDHCRCLDSVVKIARLVPDSSSPEVLDNQNEVFLGA